MKKSVWVTSFFLVSLMTTQLAFGLGPDVINYSLDVATLKAPSGETTLKVNIKDVNPKAGVCPYYVKAFRYSKAAQVLHVTVFQEVCLNDAFGASEGDVLWVVPKDLQKKNSKLTVFVNQTWAGVLSFNESQNSFEVTGK